MSLHLQSSNRNRMGTVSQIMVTELVGGYDSVSYVVACWILANDVHVFIAKGKLDLWGCRPVTHRCHSLVHCWWIYAEELLICLPLTRLNVNNRVVVLKLGLIVCIFSHLCTMRRSVMFFSFTVRTEHG
ncbi:unnamed protein product [Chrysodeixis includens]|uniref:Uncharacterized protein n=1 Tax=Chrysodeixis includens TaxID=689277 RepID=A0A9N8KZ53_CHRIL|nr:unnamed protein product [Chrysodeixis includens]